MYHMSESEFMQYEIAEIRLKELRSKHADELQDAYDGIHPTRTVFDYERGVYSESVNPADYAIYLVELREEHERIEKWWELRAIAYQDALNQLAEPEHAQARKEIKGILSLLIENRPDLQRRFIPLDDLDDIEEVDRRIDQMSMDELQEDYWNLDDYIDEERLKEQCIRLYETHDMAYSKISRMLGIETSRVKKYVKSMIEGDSNAS